MNKLFLKFVMLPTGLWRGMGADTDQLKAILDTKLKLDDRKPLSFGRKSKKKNARFNSVLQMFLSAVMGFIAVMPLATFNDEIFGLFGFYTVFLFILTFTLITDFSTVVTDTRDKFIILPRPVNDKTLFLSRMLHILIYLFRIVLPMSLPGWIVLGLQSGWKAVVLFPLPLLLMVFMAVFFVNACYLLILRLAKPGRFQDIINTFQITFSILLIVFYYTLQGVMSRPGIENFDVKQLTWISIAPSFWLASCFTWVGIHTGLAHTMILSLLAVVFPIVGLWVTVKWLAPKFAMKIGAIDADTPQHYASKKVSAKSGRLYLKLANLLNKNDATKAGFIITWLQTNRSRTFKTKVYPSLAYIPVYFVFLLFMNGKSSVAEVWQNLPNTNKHLLLLYMSAFAIMNAMNYITLSDQYKAAWIYHSAPIEKPGHVLIGAFQVLWLKFYLPFITLIGIFVVYVWGMNGLLDVLLATMNVSVFILCVMRISFKAFPFSLMENMKATGGKTFIRVLGTFLLIGVLGFGHYLASFFWWLKVLFFILSAIFFWLVWDSYKNTDWGSLRKVEEGN